MAMGGSKRQLATLLPLCVVFLAVLGYRLLVRDVGPESASAGVPEALDSQTPMTGIETVAGDVTWRLPETEALQAILVTGWTPPSSDPFQMSDRILKAAEGDLSSAAQPPDGRDGQSTVPTPSFAVRSTFQVAGRWFAEINERVYRVGDTIQGFLISEIGPDAVRVAPLGVVEDDASARPGEGRPQCLIRVDSREWAYTGGRWQAPGVSAVADSSRGDSGPMSTFEVRVGDDLD